MSWFAIAAMSSMGSSSSMTEADKDEKVDEVLTSVGGNILQDSMGKIISIATSPIGFLKSVGVLDPYTAFDVGQDSYAAEFQHDIDAWSAPWTSYWRNNRAQLEGTFGKFYYDNRMGGYIGKQVGGAIGWIVGLWFPALQPLFTELFGELGGLLGTFLSAWSGSDVVHPDIPGSPGEIEAPEAPYVPPGHDPAWFVETEPTPPLPPPIVPRVRRNRPAGWTVQLAKIWHYM